LEGRKYGPKWREECGSLEWKLVRQRARVCWKFESGRFVVEMVKEVLGVGEGVVV
jgi:hypothetical protein